MENPSRDNEDVSPLYRRDPWLTPYEGAVRERIDRYRIARAEINGAGGPLGALTGGHHYFGFNRGEKDGANGVWYREWAPGAHGLFLVGDFNGWDRGRHPLTRDEWGVWHLFLPDGEAPPHGGRVKVHVHGADGSRLDRIPAYARRTVQDPPDGGDFVTEVWLPPEPFAWAHDVPTIPASGEGLRIYEAHVGMAPEEGRVGSYREFATNVLPRVAALGYNAVQLMAVQEHPYYGSFGYHVSSFFGVSSRFGTPEDLQALIDAAHGMGLLVFLDLVHSHAVKNLNEGLSRFDGTNHQYFHAGPRGYHPAWDSLLFDYSKYEVRRFLLSNVRYWLEEYRFDGFRFDGVTSMLYLDHGLNKVFTSYGEYFGPGVDTDAVAYLQTANDVARAVRAGAVTIAEDVSGMPGMARPADEGGIGFGYRLAMGVPDFWIKLLKEKADEDWPLTQVWHTLLDRRRDEKHVGYAESHDQALVGDQTLAFRMMDAAMYTDMAEGRASVVVDRGVALHKLIRLLTFSLAGEAWLNFMGNEFGHPEWVDFPREGNNWSYHHARRQWSLADDPALRYRGLHAFDAALMDLDRRFHVLPDPLIEQLALHEDTKQLVYRRGPLVFAVSLHPTHSVEGLRIPVPDAATNYRVILSTDDPAFSGPSRAVSGSLHPVQPVEMYGRGQGIQVYLPSRCGLVLAPT
jgi:1,4-alpha-glucan branching enzyme